MSPCPWQTLSVLWLTWHMVRPTFCMVQLSFCVVWPAFCEIFFQKSLKNWSSYQKTDYRFLGGEAWAKSDNYHNFVFFIWRGVLTLKKSSWPLVMSFTLPAFPNSMLVTLGSWGPPLLWLAVGASPAKGGWHPPRAADTPLQASWLPPQAAYM